MTEAEGTAPRAAAESEERELKFADVELSGLRERLAELESERVHAPAFEDNWVFDRDGQLVGKNQLLRLRIDGRGATLTFKGPPRFEENVKVRLEHETRLDDADGMRSILEALGYRVVRRYQKMREVWRLGGVTISLDHTPIGDFAEFEGMGGDKVAKRCGFDPGRAERRNYLRLWEDYTRDHPDAAEDMTFE